jgi:hypothetical protein
MKSVTMLSGVNWSTSVIWSVFSSEFRRTEQNLQKSEEALPSLSSPFSSTTKRKEGRKKKNKQKRKEGEGKRQNLKSLGSISVACLSVWRNDAGLSVTTWYTRRRDCSESEQAKVQRKKNEERDGRRTFTCSTNLLRSEIKCSPRRMLPGTTSSTASVGSTGVHQMKIQIDQHNTKKEGEWAHGRKYRDLLE